MQTREKGRKGPKHCVRSLKRRVRSRLADEKWKIARRCDATTLHYTRRHDTTRHDTTHNTLHTTPCHTTPHSIIWHCTTLPHIALHYVTLHYITLHLLHHHKCNCNYATLITLHHNYSSTTLRLQLQLHYTTLHRAVVGEVAGLVTTATIATTPKKKAPIPCRSISGFALPSVIHRNYSLL